MSNITDTDRINWLCDRSKVYAVCIQTQPHGETIHGELRSAIDTAMSTERKKPTTEQRMRLLETLKRDPAIPPLPEPDGSAVGGDFYNGLEWLACWLLDNVEGETITEEQLRPWAIKAWEAHLNPTNNQSHP